MSSLIIRPTPYIKLKLMMSGPLRLLRLSLEQILAACHWKSHNTFTQFYLKDVAWADSELYHLGPVVAAQQIHQQTGT